MDNSVSSWFSELGMDDPHFDEQCDIMDFFDEELSAALGEDLQNSLSQEDNTYSSQEVPFPHWGFPEINLKNTYSSTLIPRNSSTTNLSALSAMEAPLVSTEIPTKQQNSKSSTSSINLNQPCCSPMVLTFGNCQQVTLGSFSPEGDTMSEVLLSQESHMNLKDAIIKDTQKKKKKKTARRVRPASQTYDHIVAERKRREQISQRFVALSALVPGLKKMDKNSVLGDAINYLKHLQERVQTLEEQAANQRRESSVLMRRSQLLIEDEGSSDEMGCTDEQILPEIEAKVCNKNILLRIHCKNHRGLLVKILSEIENRNLSVVNTYVAPFGSLALDISIIAEMDKEFNLTMQELVRRLRSALRQVQQSD